eukprot:CAMPEP_0172775640 /NCGR_PEP_ID=MMETSP1074-20121228/198331_1 /TAXON_ID=2916 /ORGANISM="Ceratium fusus, Strain PA161109" /LENGTH=52 /DNA_ID=CAMNT_0013612283 /DNA_START=21 /DNA_END=179 /DNA_ORIENTATION=-
MSPWLRVTPGVSATCGGCSNLAATLWRLGGAKLFLMLLRASLRRDEHFTPRT